MSAADGLGVGAGGAVLDGTEKGPGSEGGRGNEQDREQVGKLAEAIQRETGESVDLAFVDQGYTGERPAEAAAKQKIELSVVKLSEPKRGFVLLPRRWVVERSFAWLTRFRRLAKDYERLASTVKGMHYAAFAIVMLTRLVNWDTSA